MYRGSNLYVNTWEKKNLSEIICCKKGLSRLRPVESNSKKKESNSLEMYKMLQLQKELCWWFFSPTIKDFETLWYRVQTVTLESEGLMGAEGV